MCNSSIYLRLEIIAILRLETSIFWHTLHGPFAPGHRELISPVRAILI